MDNTFWQKQGSESLFPELEWNKPERRDQSGRLLIVGGSSHALSAPAEAFETAKKAGLIDVKTALPASAKRFVPDASGDFVFLPATTSGEFAKDDDDSMLSYAQWADTVLLPGDIGRNSQTTILLSNLLKDYSGQIVITRDAFDSLVHNPELLLNREKTSLILSFGQLQKLVKESREVQALTHQMELVRLVNFLHGYTLKYQAAIVTLFQRQLIVASHGNVSTTKVDTVKNDQEYVWRVKYASTAACYQTWNPFKPFEALTHAAASLINA